MNSNLIVGISDENIKLAEEKYALIEPLLDDYLPAKDRKKLFKEICVNLNISHRTLRRMIQRLKSQGLISLSRKKRSDAGTLKVVSVELIDKAIELLKQNSNRSVSMAIKLLKSDPHFEKQAENLTLSTMYHHLKKAGFDFGNRDGEPPSKIFHHFEAEYPNHLWQGEARHGIPLPDPANPERIKMTFLYAWVDDFSRKILYARYYWDEKLPCLEDCFKHATLRWGLPVRIYCDNGSTYIAHKFTFLVNSLGIKKIHHPPYHAWCKGKVEAVMKIIKSFQNEARMASFKTLDELNQTLFAWIDVEYNNKIHSSTGETPNDRFRKNLQSHPIKRILDLDKFNSLFFFREERTVNKYGQIRFNSNFYKITSLKPGEIVDIVFDPFDLSQVAVFHQGKFFCFLKAYKLTSSTYQNIPQEHDKNPATVSKEAQAYFNKIRQKHLENSQKNADSIRFSKLSKEDSHGGQN